MDGTPLRLLLIDDSEADSELMMREVTTGGYDPVYARVATAQSLTQALLYGSWDLAICDYSMPGFSGAEALQQVNEQAPKLPFMFVSGTIPSDFARNLTSDRVADVLSKNRLEGVLPAIERILKARAIQAEVLAPGILDSLERERLTGQVRVLERTVAGLQSELYRATRVPFQAAVGHSAAEKELAFQYEEKEARAAKLVIANKELAFQNGEKEKRAAELVVANKELAFQSEEKDKRAAELLVANKELAFQNEEKEKRAGDLIVANKELVQFAYIASHDLQEPLRTVSNYMQLFETEYAALLDGNARKYLQSANSAAKRMSLLIQSLLSFSRLGMNKKLTSVDCARLIDDVIADLDTVIQTSGARIDVGGMPRLNVYETEMRQLFQNLIANAIKFQKKGTRPWIKISSERVKDKWTFTVSDNGIGIAAAHFDRIFDIFQRLHTNGEYEGSGIGLANCKKIAHLHQGELWVESTLGQGARFYFTISNLTG